MLSFMITVQTPGLRLLATNATFNATLEEMDELRENNLCSMVLVRRLEYNFSPTYIDAGVSCSFRCLHIRDSFLDGVLFLYLYVIS